MRWGGAAVLLLLLLTAGGRSHASPTDGQDKAKDLTLTARDLSDQGLRQYQRGELDNAIESFMGAFALSNNSGLLFNVAQAYRLKGDCGHAKDYYRRYLDAAPDSALRPSVERRLIEMEGCAKPATAVAANAAREAAPDHDAVTRPAPAPAPALLPSYGPTAREPAAASPTSRALAWTLRGSAAALLVSAAVFGVAAWEARRDFDATSNQRQAQDANDRYHLDSTLAWSFDASGAACALVSFLVGRRP